MVVTHKTAAVRYIRSTFVNHTIDVSDKIMNSRTWSVTGGEEEHVEKENGVVVEKMAECSFCQLERDRSSVCNTTNVRDAVDVRYDLLKGAIPGWVDNIGELGLGDGNMPAANPGRIDVMGE